MVSSVVCTVGATMGGVSSGINPQDPTKYHWCDLAVVHPLLHGWTRPPRVLSKAAEVVVTIISFKQWVVECKIWLKMNGRYMHWISLLFHETVDLSVPGLKNSTKSGPAPVLGVLPVPVHHQTPQHARQRSGSLEGVGQVGWAGLLAKEKVAFDLKKMGSLDKQQEHWIISYSGLMSLCAMYTHQQSCRLTQPYLSINHASIPALISYVLKACMHLQLHACIYHVWHWDFSI